MRTTLGRTLWFLMVPVPGMATSSFDPEVVAETFDDSSPLVTDGEGLPLWDRIERLEDGNGQLFPDEVPAPGFHWDDASWISPHINDLLGDSTPNSGTFLLHFAPGWSLPSYETPVLLIPGAATTASGVFPVLARALGSDGRAVFAISFPHPHQDNFQAAELVADAVHRILTLTGASQVDLIAHSKGGIAAAVHLSHGPVADWQGARGDLYEAHGTAYAGTVRRFIAVGVPLGGLDTAFRWTASALLQAGANTFTSPSPWETYYPLTTVNPFVNDDLRAVDLWADAGDAFPGQGQLLARWEDVHPLPGSRLDLDAYALQQDWWTTYEGGLGLVSDSRGIDDAIADAGDLILQLSTQGLPAGLELAVLAGRNPFIPVHQDFRVSDPWGDQIGGFLGQDGDFYRDFYEEALAGDFPELEISDGDAAGLASGALLAGEISGESDGVVFVDSATAVEPWLARGAVLLETAIVDLSHIDLLLASPGSAMALRASSVGTPDEAAIGSLADRYEAVDSVGWILSILRRGEVDPGDDDSAGDDDSTPGDDDSAVGDDSTAGDDDSTLSDADPETPLTGCGGCQQSGAVPGLLPLVAAGARRRKKDRVASPGADSAASLEGTASGPETTAPTADDTFADAVLSPWVDGLHQLRRYVEQGPARPVGPAPWTTPHRTELSLSAADLRVFGAAVGRTVLIVAPEINGAQIADYGPGQSLVETVLGQGWDRVGLVAWRSAGADTRDLTISDSVQTIVRCAQHLGGPLPLLGICQGGWEATLVAATRPELVSALILGAGPIDFHAGNGTMSKIARSTPLLWYQGLVALGGGVVRGDLLRSGFDSLRPLERFSLRWVQLWNGLDDPDFMERHDRLEGWYGARKDLPGRMYLEAVTELFQGNKLVRGEFELDGKRVDLRRIACPVALVGGTKDHITPMDQVWALEPHLVQAPHTRFVVDAGHVGIFVGRQALSHDWPKILAWVETQLGTCSDTPAIPSTTA